MKHLARTSITFLAVGAITLVSACGNDSTGPKSSSTLSPQEALLVASGIMTEVSRAFSTSTAKRNISAGSLNVAAMPTET
ncbi:MAG: hypothetical protein ACREBE_07750, partial [bacterium]